MENFDFTQTVSTVSLSTMAASLLIVILFWVFWFRFLRKGFPEGHQGLFAGLATYIIVCRAILVVMYFLKVKIDLQIDKNVADAAAAAAFKNSSAVIFLLLQCLVFVLCVWFSYKKFFYQPDHYSFGDTLMFGYGFTLFETGSFLFTTFMNWMMGSTLNSTGLSVAYEQIGKEDWEAYWNDIGFLYQYKTDYFAVLLLERFVYALMIMALLVMIHVIVRSGRKKTWLFAVSGLYFLYYIPAILKQFGMNIGYWGSLGICLAVSVITAVINWKIMKKYAEDDVNRLNEIFEVGIWRTMFPPKKTIYGDLKKSDPSKKPPRSMREKAMGVKKNDVQKNDIE